LDGFLCHDVFRPFRIHRLTALSRGVSNALAKPKLLMIRD